eukprot:scaffold15554_cov155-Skeletonema_dohrnii-CCMP3373.AAC.5
MVSFPSDSIPIRVAKLQCCSVTKTKSIIKFKLTKLQDTRIYSLETKIHESSRGVFILVLPAVSVSIPSTTISTFPNEPLNFHLGIPLQSSQYLDSSQNWY